MGFIANLFNPPKAPKPSQQVAAQNTLNQQTQAMNLAAAHTNQVGPTGTQTWQQHGTDPKGNPLYTSITQLSPDQQAILDQLEQNQQGIGGLIQTNIAGANANTIPTFENLESLVKPMLDKHLAYINPYYTQQSNSLDATLRNQGLLPGTPAYDRAMRTLKQTQNESIGQFLNSAQQQAFNQSMELYKTPFNTIAQLYNMSSPAGASFTPMPATSVTAPNIIAAQQQAYQNQLNQFNAAWGGLGGIGGAILGGAPGTLAGSIGGGLANMFGLGGVGAGIPKIF